MNRPAASAFVLLAAFFLVPGGVARSGPATPPAAGDKVRVVATVLPLAEFARSIAGDRGDIVLLLPPGTDVHSWQPRASDIRTVQKADLLISVGLGLEPWLDSLVRGADAKDVRRLEAAAGLEPLAAGEEDGHDHAGTAHGREAFDPHVWLDFGLDEKIVDALSGELSRIAPADAAFFEANAGALKGRLRDLDASFREALAPHRGRDLFLAGHAAFAYLARRYGLRQVAVYGSSPDAAPTPRETASIIGRARAAGVKTVFYEPATGDKMARLIAAEIGADVRILQTGHTLNPRQAAAGLTFFDLMKENLENLKHGLSGK